MTAAGMAPAPAAGAPSFVFPWSGSRACEPLRDREWLVTNGLGGYASGSVLGIATRRHHGLLVAALAAPRGRTVLVPRVDDAVVVEDGRTIPLSGAEMRDGLESWAHDHLVEFRQEWQVPAWTFALADRRLRKRVGMAFGQNSVWVEWTLLDGPPLRLRLRPYVTFRQLDEPLGGVPPEWPFTLVVTRDRCEVHPFEGSLPIRLALRPRSGVLVVDPRESAGVCYRVERERGYPHVEDLYSPGYLARDLVAGESVAFVASTEPWALLELAPPQVFAAERARLERLLAQAPPAARTGTPAQLVLAADQFVVTPGSRLEERTLARAAGEEVRTVIAGYHWFTDWGRDTMISLEGLTLCTGRHAEARAILTTFAHYVEDGLLPNQFPEGARRAIYNTIDATLWYFHAVDRYVTVTGDRTILSELFPTLASIVEHHLRGTRHGIGVDAADGLLRGGAEGLALTWMDATCQGWVVTPRRGKPVEIQALWYDALRLMDDWARALGRADATYRDAAERAARGFDARFWDESGRHCLDVVDGPQGDDASLRPNQIFTCSLRHPILGEPRRRPMLDTVAARLLTPVGLRTLDPGHPEYRSQYQGDLRTRDAAYHQGTVWPWLLGHYLDAWRRVDPAAVDARALLAGLERHLSEAGVGSVSEVFDAEPPHVPRACIAQAWSVAEMLRGWLATGAG